MFHFMVDWSKEVFLNFVIVVRRYKYCKEVACKHLQLQHLSLLDLRNLSSLLSCIMLFRSTAERCNDMSL